MAIAVVLVLVFLHLFFSFCYIEVCLDVADLDSPDVIDFDSLVGLDSLDDLDDRRLFWIVDFDHIFLVVLVVVESLTFVAVDVEVDTPNAEDRDY